MRIFSQKGDILTKKKSVCISLHLRIKQLQTANIVSTKDGQMKNMLKKTCLSLVIIQGKALQCIRKT